MTLVPIVAGDVEPSGTASLAERVGFEPTELAFGCFQDSCLQPLGHLSSGHGNATIAGGRPPTRGRPGTVAQGLAPLARPSTTSSNPPTPQTPSSQSRQPVPSGLTPV